MRTQRRWRWLGVMALPILGCDGTNPTTQVANQDFSATAPLEIDLDATGRAGFRLEGINGNVTVTGVSGTDAFLIRGHREVRSESVADAEANLPQLQVVATVTATVIVIRTVQPLEDDGRGYRVDYVLTVPQRLAGAMTNVNGDVSVTSMRETAAVTNVNGNIRFTDHIGDMGALLTNGNIVGAMTIPVDGTADLQTVNGNVELELPVATSAAFSASLTNGTITVTGLTLQNPVSTSTSLSGTLGSGQGTVNLRTVNGNILARGI